MKTWVCESCGATVLKVHRLLPKSASVMLPDGMEVYLEGNRRYAAIACGRCKAVTTITLPDRVISELWRREKRARKTEEG